jgi:hypothetical protein
MRPLRRHLTFANVISCIALFVALATGGAYAAGTIFSSDIADGEVKSVDIGDDEIRARDVLNEALGSGEVLNNSLRGADIAPDSLGGADIQESTLTEVPVAGVADKLGDSTEADLDTGTSRSLAECDPTTPSFIQCGDNPLGITLDATSDVLVIASGVWTGTGDGAESGECLIVVDNGSAGTVRPYGQRGNVHDTPARGAPIAQTSAFPSLPPGAYDISMMCRETDANFVVDFIELTAIRLGGRDPDEPQ